MALIERGQGQLGRLGLDDALAIAGQAQNLMRYAQGARRAYEVGNYIYDAAGNIYERASDIFGIFEEKKMDVDRPKRQRRVEYKFDGNKKRKVKEKQKYVAKKRSQIKMRRGGKTVRRKRRRKRKRVLKKKRYKRPNQMKMLKRLIRRTMRNAPIYGRMLRKCVKNNGLLSHNSNQCSYEDFYIATDTQLNGLMDDEYIKLGQTDALAVREETYNFIANALNNTWKLLFKGVLVIELRNNYNYDVQMDVYYTVPIHTQESTANADMKEAIQFGLDRKSAVTNWNTSVCWHPRHSDMFRKNWRTVKYMSFRIRPGGEKTLSVSTGWKMYNQQIFNANQGHFLKGLTKGILIRQQGIVLHDNTNGGAGYCEGRIDYVRTRIWRFRHVGQNQVQRYTESQTLAPVPDDIIIPGGIADENVVG